MKVFRGFSILLIFLFCFIAETYGQLTKAEIIGSYVYNFGNKISWSNNTSSEFNIILLCSDEEIINEFKKMASRQKIHNKKINLEVISEPNEDALNKAQLIYICNQKLSYYLSIYDMVEGKEVLIVSHNYENKSYVMLNLFDTKDKKLLFEVNKPNIINQGLSFDDEILLMGGTEIDIASIYLKSQHSLRNMEIKMNSYEQQLKNLKNDIEWSNKKVNQQQQKIKSQEQEIESKKSLMTEQLSTIDDYKSVIEKQLLELHTSKTHLGSLNDSLNKNKSILSSQNQEIQNSKRFLIAQSSKIDSINSEIEKKNAILNDKDATIGLQKKRMNMLLLIICGSIILIAVIVFAYYQIRKRKKQLQKQKVVINKINKELKDNNEELKSTLEDVRKMQEQLVQSEKMASLGVLSAGIAHEINNPINFVYAGINSLLRDFEDIEPVIEAISKLNPSTENLKSKLIDIERLKEQNYFEEAYEAIPQIINDIKIGADRTAEIIKGLRSFSRIDKGEMNMLDIHEGIDTSLLLLKNKYKTHVEIVKEYDSNIDMLKCFPGKINQAFLNILSNAIDSIEEKGLIKISTKQNDAIIAISIKDNGCGMNLETQQKIFDPFFTTKDVGEGTGLGLSITYGIIKEHKGNIEVISELQKGTEFIIELPIN